MLADVINGGRWPHQQMHMIGHDHISPQMILVLGQSNGRGADEPTTASILAEKRAIVETGEIERMGMAGIVESLASLRRA